ncbi:hypothetical protein MB46_18570 [Arthrobacter alpinus]|uniref:hypothetical protein n=1 Tax=Arthrobacter alpinus TaxID=656366 RepID=UPI0005C9EC61|nr:hypothetical protein [Arthrobacter alpinus]ALV47197.1 hypothetical protein MB46_18570 [Arthrobacter alpinus]
MRELDPKAAAYFAATNPNIVASDTLQNIAMVNDGAGGFRRPTSKEEVLDYGDDRINKVHRKISTRSFETTLIVIHLPKSMCVEVPDFYPVVDKEGVHQLNKDGSPRMKSRWVARDRDEAIRFFSQALTYYGNEVLTGGSEAIHGYDINFDEATPHVQVMADTFAPDPKHDGSLRVDASRMWGSHPEVRDANGKQIGGSRKMRRYQAGLRQRMHDLGYPVELKVDQKRSMSKQGKEEYIETQDRLVEIAEDEESLRVGRRRLDMDLHDHRYRHAAVGSLLAEVHEKNIQVDAGLESLPELRRKAHQEGFAAGQSDLAAARAELPALRQKARDDGKAEGAAAAQNELTQERSELAEKIRAAELALARARSVQRAGQTRRAEAVMEADKYLADAKASALRMRSDLIQQSRTNLPNLFEEYLELKGASGQPLRVGFDRFVDQRLKAFEAEHGIKAGDLILDPGDREQFIQDGGASLAAEVDTLQRQRQMGN